MNNKIISGIYKIENKVNGKVYIGSSKNIKNRWGQHVNMLKNKKHHSIKLQRAWDKYGEDEFEFKIIEECGVDKLLYLEQYYIDKYKSYFEGYNSKEKTRDMYTEEDYIRDSNAENNAIMFLNTVVELEHIKMVFFDKKTWDNITKKKENIKMFEKEYLVYRNILEFVNAYFSNYNDIFVVVRNNKKENFTGFSYFSNKSEEMRFEVHLRENGIIVECRICVENGVIIIINSVEEEGYDYIFSNNKIKRDDYINELMAYIYYPCRKRERLTDEYFKRVIKLLNDNNIGHPSNYKYLYGNCSGFVDAFKEYVFKENLSYFIQKEKSKGEFKQVKHTDKDYKQLFLSCLQ